MVVIRLSRTGTSHKPKYRLTVADSRRSVKGHFIEIIGHYDPLSKDKKTVIDKEKYESWLKKGAKPSQTVKSLFVKLYQKNVVNKENKMNKEKKIHQKETKAESSQVETKKQQKNRHQ